jgi:hypothetical protein
MATTKERLDLLTRHPAEPNDHTRRRPEGVGVAAPRVAATNHWPTPAVVLLAVGIAVEPPPTNPAAVDPWFVSALSSLLLGALLTTVAGLGMRRRWSLAASLLAAGVLVVSTLMCPVSGHHTGVGGWWVVQLGCGLGLVATSILAWHRATPQ